MPIEQVLCRAAGAELVLDAHDGHARERALVDEDQRDPAAGGPKFGVITR